RIRQRIPALPRSGPTHSPSSSRIDKEPVMAAFRIEHDSMGELQVPADALWGAQTQRAVQNFPISGRPMPRGFIRALGLVKASAAAANAALGLVRETLTQAVAR